MSDRMDDVLAAIDETLAGADDDWTVSGDAMRWTPPEQQEASDKSPTRVSWSPDVDNQAAPTAAELGTGIDLTDQIADAAASTDGTRTATYRMTIDLRPLQQSINYMVSQMQEVGDQRTLRTVVTDEAERGMYLDACDGSASLAIDYASHGIPASLVRDLRAIGLDAFTAARIANTDGPHTSAEEALGAVMAFVRGYLVTYHGTREPAREEPSTPEAVRRRALEARRSRNTGPARHDNRRWRNT